MNYTGLALAPVDKVRPGRRLIADDGFPCMPEYAERVVRFDEDGELYVECDDGRHGLDGQLDVDGENYVGFWIKANWVVRTWRWLRSWRAHVAAKA